jgi:hypothetical protein
LPPRFERYLSAVVRLTAADRKRLLNGEPITKLLDSDASKEVAVFGAVWVGAAPSRYIDLVTDIENFERGGPFRVTKMISTPPQRADSTAVDLPADDVADLRSCRVGRCELKLGPSTMNLWQFRYGVEERDGDRASDHKDVGHDRDKERNGAPVRNLMKFATNQVKHGRPPVYIKASVVPEDQHGLRSISRPPGSARVRSEH